MRKCHEKSLTGRRFREKSSPLCSIAHLSDLVGYPHSFLAIHLIYTILFSFINLAICFVLTLLCCAVFNSLAPFPLHGFGVPSLINHVVESANGFGHELDVFAGSVLNDCIGLNHGTYTPELTIY